MNKLGLLLISAAGGMCMSGSGHAQNSVTLYGVLDTSLAFVHNDGGKNTAQALSGNLSGNRWGLKGAEDLGSGLSAIFALESGFDPNTGKSNQGGRLFGRQAFVGLDHKQYGTFTVGRQYTPTTDMVAGITGDNYGAAFVTPGDVDNFDNSIRVNNAVKYVSPTFGGLQAEAMYALGGQAGATSSGSSWGGALAFNRGPLALAGSYEYYNGGAVTNGVRTFSTATADSPFYSSVNQGYASAKSIKIARAAAQYTLDKAILGIAYGHVEYTHDGASVFNTTQKFNTASVAAAYNWTPSFLTALGYSFTKSSGDSSARYNQVSILGDYSISKRTDFYVIGGWQHASGTTRSADGASIVPAQATVGDYAYTGANQAAQEFAAIGIRHKF